MKRVNILNVFKNEIEKGNKLILGDGTFVNKESFESAVEREFLQLFRQGKISKKETFENFYMKELETCIDAQAMLNKIASDFNLDIGGVEDGTAKQKGNSKGTESID